MTAKTNTSNIYRRVRALVAKTADRGAEPAEMAAAYNKARDLIEKHGLDASRIEWPAKAPAGYRIKGNRMVEAKAKRRKAKPGEYAPRPGTKAAGIVEILKRPGGATATEILAAYPMQPHSLRGLLSGVVRTKMGLTVMHERKDGTTRYWVEG